MTKENVQIKALEYENTINHDLALELCEALCDSFSEKYCSPTLKKGILKDAVFFDSIPLSVRNNETLLRVDMFKQELELDLSSNSASTNNLYFMPRRTLLDIAIKYSEQKLMLLKGGMKHILNIKPKDIIIHRENSTDNLGSNEIGYYNKVAFQKVEVSEDTLSSALKKKAFNNMEELKNLLKTDDAALTQYTYGLSSRDFLLILSICDGLGIEEKLDFRKMFVTNYSGSLTSEYTYVFTLESETIHKMNDYLDSLKQEVTMGGECNDVF